MRHAVDKNQAQIIKALKRIPGCEVRSLSQVGNDIPDLLIGYGRKNWLMEVKNLESGKSKAKLRPGQQRFADTWPGQVATVYGPVDALAVIGVRVI